jgi:hypothetical protein
MVMVDDNAHYMDASERRRHAEFPTCAAAIAACQRLVDDHLRSAYRPGMTAEALWADYTRFGDDPFIVTTDEQCRFSAWDYARQRCAALCRPGQGDA